MTAATERFDLQHARGATAHFYGDGAIVEMVGSLGEAVSGRQLFVVSARPVLDLHESMLEPLRQASSSLEILEVADGEEAKKVGEVERLWRSLSGRGARRDSVLAGFGGGSVTDLAGFAAGAFLRGIDWLALPTTLLGQVDAAIGGKTAIDLPEAKNSVGLFHHPLAVAAEPAALATLSTRLRRAGLTEAVKAGAVLDPGLFDRIEREVERLLEGEPRSTAAVVSVAARAKAALVAADAEEAGSRKLLNFGHTLGHAIEAEVGYGRIEHGDAVAHGMRFALRLSVADGGETAFAERVARLIDRLAPPPLPKLEARALIDRIGRDKKALRDGVGWVLLVGPGRARWGRKVEAHRLESELEAFLGGSSSGPL
jgi:3-dehydroquinate synthetase